MPPEKEKKVPSSPLNTTAQIQQIFSEVQSQLPSVNFDSDDQNDDDHNEEESLDESNLQMNGDMLLESVLSNSNISFLTLHPKIETPAHLQQPPSVELQMRISPNLFDYSQIQEPPPPQPPVLSMDLFNNIDFDKIIPSTTTIGNDPPQIVHLTPTFHRPRPITNTHDCTSTQQQINMKIRDDRHVLERLAQQANKLNHGEVSQPAREHNPFRNLESALCAALHEPSNSRRDKRATLPESQRKTIYIDLRNSQIEKKPEIIREQHQSIVRQSTESSSTSEDDDDDNDGMLWFEKRRQIQKQRTNPSIK